MNKKNSNSKLLDYESLFWSPDYIEASAWIEHLPFGFWIIEVVKPRVVVELGVHNGTSYFCFCQAVKRMNLDAACYGIDTWKGDEHAGFYGEEVFEKVTTYNTRQFSRISSLIRSTFDEATEYFLNGTIDFLHIDGMHTYEAVKHDFESWLPKLSERAIVILHDTNVRERNFGVFKFWEELKQQYPHLQFDFGHGLGMVAVGQVVPKALNDLLEENQDGGTFKFLRNIFSERGAFFRANFANESNLNAKTASLTALTAVNAQLVESANNLEARNLSHEENKRARELEVAHLNQRIAELDSVIAQLNERVNTLQTQNAEVLEKNKMLEASSRKIDALELDNRKLVENNERLEKHFAKLESTYKELREINERRAGELAKELTTAQTSLENISRELAATKDQNESFKKYLSWYRDTYEYRSILGVLKEKLTRRLKKKLISPVASQNGSQIAKRQNPLLIPDGYAIVINKASFYLNPVNNIEVSGQWYSATGADPFFIIDLKDQFLGPGWYRLNLEVREEKGVLLSPKFYFDRGSGFSENDVWNLPKSKNGKIESLMKLSGNVVRLRFDPTTIECVFSISKFRLKKVSRLTAFQVAVSHYKLKHPQLTRQRVVLELTNSFLKKGLKEVKNCLWETVTNNAEKTDDRYLAWCELYDTISKDQFNIIRSASHALSYQPLFSIVMPVYNVPPIYLKKAIESVLNQAYETWELCIADDNSTDREVKRLLKQYQSRDPRIKVVFRDTNGGISRASNSALELASGDYMVLLDDDDELPPHALYIVAKAISANKSLQLIYTDEDKIDELGKRYDPYFKTDWNKDLFYGQNMINHLGVYKLDLVKKVGRFRPPFDGSQDYDLALRCIEHLSASEIHHIPHVLYHWRALKGSAAFSIAGKTAVVDAGLRALQDHLTRTRQNAIVVPNIHSSYRVKWSLPTDKPMVSIIIPTKDKVEVLSTCVDSVLGKTGYRSFELLIIDNNSEDCETLQYLKRLQRQNEQVKVFRYECPFNFSAIMNYGVQQSTGQVIVLLNNDTEVINDDWLTEMVSQSLRQEIGVVGAKLYYPNGQIQHAGVFLYEGHPGNHIYLRREKNDPGYFNKLNLVQNYSVVTAACLAVRKEVYIKAGGFDEEHLRVAYNDVDFCLKVRELGYTNLWTPFAQLVHHESLSRGNDLDGLNFARFKKEHGYMLAKWKNAIKFDPFFNPNLGHDTRTTQFAFPPRIKYEWQGA